jgi:hypothetical protein
VHPLDPDPDSDPDPQHCFKDYVCEKVFYNLVLLQDHGQDFQQGEQRIKKQDSLTKVKYRQFKSFCRINKFLV